MEETVLLDLVGSFPGALIATLSSLPLAVWLCVAFMVVAATLTRVLDG